MRKPTTIHTDRGIEAAAVITVISENMSIHGEYMGTQEFLFTDLEQARLFAHRQATEEARYELDCYDHYRITGTVCYMCGNAPAAILEDARIPYCAECWGEYVAEREEAIAEVAQREAEARAAAALTPLARECGVTVERVLKWARYAVVTPDGNAVHVHALDPATNHCVARFCLVTDSVEFDGFAYDTVMLSHTGGTAETVTPVIYRKAL